MLCINPQLSQAVFVHTEDVKDVPLIHQATKQPRLDFFVKLGQALIPNKKATSSSSSVAFNEGLSPVAYLGSYFYGMLQKGHASDGRQGWRMMGCV